ncbi:hypothetical protein D3C85_1694060 [compost metagenome]
MACYFIYGEIPYKYQYDFVRFNKTKGVEIPMEKLTQAKNTIKFNFHKMESYIRYGKFPANYQEFYCNNFCGYQRLCPTYAQFSEGR